MKKQFGIAMIALSAAMALTFTACGDDSSSGNNDPKIVDKVDDLSEDCEDGEEALVGADKILYTCTDGKWATEAKSSSSKVTSSSEEEECNPDLENCDEEKDENKEEEVEEEETKPSKGDSGSGSGSGGSGSGEGGSGSGSEEPETPKCTDTEEQLCVNGELVDKANVKNCGEARYNSTTHFCYTDDDIGASLTYPYCPGKKTYTPMVDGECGEDGNYYYTYMDDGKKYAFEDTRDGNTYLYTKIGNLTWMIRNLNFSVSGAMQNSSKYGKFMEYNWNQAMNLAEEYAKTTFDVPENYQGICPAGWHIPSSVEWNELLELGGEQASSFLDDKLYENATNTIGFSAYGGSRSASYMVSTNEDNHMYYVLFDPGQTSQVKLWTNNNKTNTRAIRCVQNTTKSE